MNCLVKNSPKQTFPILGNRGVSFPLRGDCHPVEFIDFCYLVTEENVNCLIVCDSLNFDEGVSIQVECPEIPELFRDYPGYIAWRGFTDCNKTTKVTTYTNSEVLALTAGVMIYSDWGLTVPYSDSYFINDGAKHSLFNGIIISSTSC